VDGASRESHLTGITTFKAQDSSPAEDLLLNEMETIDLHHGLYSADPPYTVLEVIGTSLSDRIKSQLSEYGFDEFPHWCFGIYGCSPSAAKLSVRKFRSPTQSHNGMLSCRTLPGTFVVPRG
jgi:hypothetical protein